MPRDSWREVSVHRDTLVPDHNEARELELYLCIDWQPIDDLELRACHTLPMYLAGTKPEHTINNGEKIGRAPLRKHLKKNHN